MDNAPDLRSSALNRVPTSMTQGVSALTLNTNIGVGIENKNLGSDGGTGGVAVDSPAGKHLESDGKHSNAFVTMED